VTALGGCRSDGDEPGATPSPHRPSASVTRSAPAATPAETRAATARAAAAVAAGLSDADLVGQLLVPYVYGADADRVSAAAHQANVAATGYGTAAEVIAHYRLGGLILVRRDSADPTAGTNPTTNIVGPAQVRRLTDGLQRAASRLPARAPLLIGTDQEGGAVTRIRQGVVRLPSAMTLGAAQDPALTGELAAMSGAELAALGLNVDFAPDADVTGGPGNLVIGSRSFGDTPARVGPQVAAAVQGYQRSGIATTLKHFPGHGHTDVDSHVDIPVLTQSRAVLDRDDLAPFRAGIAAGSELVMSGHLDVRSIDPGTPATLSHTVLTDVLRTQLGFRGVVITDGMDMAGLTKHYQPAEAAVRAILAGNDMLLLPPSLKAAQQGLLGALKSGRLPRARAVEAVTRILTLKHSLPSATAPGTLGVLAQPSAQQSATAPPSAPSAQPSATAQPSAGWRPALTTLDSPAHRALGDRVAAAAITVLKGPCTGPLVRGPVTVTGATPAQRAVLTATLRAAGVTIGTGGSTVHLASYGDGTADLVPATVTVALDTPYILAAARSPILVAAYSGVDASLRAAAAVLAGRAKAPGRSPVAVRNLPRSAC
jgi:beta-N-acetylhexosaminidase